MKKVSFLAISLLICQLAFSQGRDESVRPPDPVKSVQVYPNPAIDFVTVKFETPLAKTSKLEFHSIIGSLLDLEQEVVDDYEIRVKIKELPIGYYIIAVHDPVNNTRAFYKFLKR
ncbi:MAG: T9SS type A sorting domain-containing protein [Bacteroidetes bacterium]|nr:T9SS type A sorting domain-containing protein [Bacteroidota bacterium]